MTDSREQFDKALDNLDELRRFTGTPQVFWQSLLESLVTVSGARVGVLLRRADEGAAPWQKVGVWPAQGVAGNGAQAFATGLEMMANASALNREALAVFNNPAQPLTSDAGIAIRLESESRPETWVAAFYLPGFSQSQAAGALKQLRLVANTPSIYHRQRASSQNQQALSHSTAVLDLLALMNAEERFLAVAMTLCNELAARHKCDRVSLGWIDGGYVRLQAISHTEKFERKMEAIKAIEQTMEESFDQDEIVVCPPPDGAAMVTRDHEAFADSQKVKFLCSVPIRVNGSPVGVVTCERNTEPFEDSETRLLGLCAEMVGRRMSELKERDCWLGARAAAATREALSKIVGVRHTWAKVISAGVAVGLAVLFFGTMNYRVKASFILRTDDIAILSAPFNGFIEEAPARPGDPVHPKDTLLKLDTRDLLLEEAAALADLDRFTRDAEKSRATNGLAEMRIAMAQAEQARVRLDSVRFHLSQAVLTAPFDGVVVEGDLKKRIAAPVKQGDPLFKIARTDRMYVECEVKENDIHEVRDDAGGQIAFASQPKLKFPMRLERIEPVAQVKDQKNIFIVRCQVQCPAESWWRPGMTGVAKLDVGRRTFFWVISHRTVDFLRMYFWL